MPKEIDPSVWILLGSIVAAAPGIGALIIALRKSKSEIHVTSANAATTFEDLATKSAARIEKLTAQLDEVRDQQFAHDLQIRELTADKVRLESENTILKARVDVLERILRDNNIPIPNGSN